MYLYFVHAALPSDVSTIRKLLRRFMLSVIEMHSTFNMYDSTTLSGLLVYNVR